MGARLLDAVPPAAGAAEMGTGIVSVGLFLSGHQGLSRALLWIAFALWLGLCTVFVQRALLVRSRWLAEARLPAGLTAIAGTAVLGTRLTLGGADTAAFVLLVLALCLWVGLLPPVLRHWQTPTVGASFVLTVSTESLAVLAATLAIAQRLEWLALAALVPFVLGLAAYVFVLARFDFRQLRVGHGDHWVAGGALAIATLACAKTAQSAEIFSSLSGLEHVLEDLSLALWAGAAVWLPVLVAVELLWLRLVYDARRWSTVFPLGMYAVCSIAAGDAAGVDGLRSFGRVWIWVAFAVWVVVFVAMALRGLTLARAAPAPEAA